MLIAPCCIYLQWVAWRGHDATHRDSRRRICEHLAEMSLIGQPAIRGDLRERCVGRQHQTLSALHSPSHHIAMRRVAHAIAESAAEMGG